MKNNIKILYEDNHIIVAIKPKGVLSQADGSDHDDMLTLLKEYIKEKYNKPGNVYLGLVHRLDMNTEGVMVFARTSKAASRLSNDIKEHIFSKKYHAVVSGILNNKEYIKLENNIYKDEKQKKSFIRNDGKLAILKYKALKNYKIDNNDVTLIDVILETGRFHQIRCQMSNIGHPLYNDMKYGNFKSNDFYLCAYSLTFTHPITKEEMFFEMEE